MDIVSLRVRQGRGRHRGKLVGSLSVDGKMVRRITIDRSYYDIVTELAEITKAYLHNKGSL